MDKKAEIQELISLGKTEEALELLGQLTTDAVLLQSRFQGAKKQYGMGMIDFSEWSRTQAQINYGALEMMNGVKEPSAGQAQQNPRAQEAPAAAEQNRPKVFLSYSHKDAFAMRSVKSFLEDHGVHVHIDLNDISAGSEIQGFIDKALRENDFVVSIISQNSLESGWVSKELTVAQFLNKTNQNWIPIAIDGAWKDDKFFFSVNDSIDKKITGVRKQMRKALDSDLDISPFTEELKRFQDLKASIGSTIATLKTLLVVDISGELFEVGMGKVVKKIKPA
ncbi:MAG: TIR domain-containing protein [Saprospiraceae bacterium]